MSTRGGFILEINKLEKKGQKNNQKGTNKTKSNQQRKKNQPKKHKQNKEGSLEGPGRVCTGQGSFLVPDQVSHCWSLFLLVPGQTSHVWSLFFGAGSEVALLVAVFPLFSRGRVKSRTFGRMVSLFFALFSHYLCVTKNNEKRADKKATKSATFYPPKVRQKVDPPP